MIDFKIQRESHSLDSEEKALTLTHPNAHPHTLPFQGPGSSSTPVMTRSSSTKKSSNKFRYSWHVTDLDDVLPNGGTPNSQVR